MCRKRQCKPDKSTFKKKVAKEIFFWSFESRKFLILIFKVSQLVLMQFLSIFDLQTPSYFALEALQLVRKAEKHAQVCFS